MSYKPDLSDPGPVKGVGYLVWTLLPKGKGRLAVLDRLVTLAEKPFLVACGYHKCNLGFCGATQIFHNEPVFRYRGRRVVLALPILWCREMKWSITRPIWFCITSATTDIGLRHASARQFSSARNHVQRNTL